MGAAIVESSAWCHQFWKTGSGVGHRGKQCVGRLFWKAMRGAAILESNAWGGHCGKQCVGRPLCESNAWGRPLWKTLHGAAIFESNTWGGDIGILIGKTLGLRELTRQFFGVLYTYLPDYFIN